MAIVGHFTSLAEAQKLVRSELLAGVVQQIYEEGQLLQKLPVTTVNSKSLLYNRESTLPSAAFYDIHEQIPWSADVSYTTQVEVALKISARQDVLDKFMMKTYKTPNDYRAIVLAGLRKGCMRTIEDKIIYGNATTYPKEFDGLDKLCAATAAHTFAGGYQDEDVGGATNGLHIAKLLELMDYCKPKPDILLMTRTLKNLLFTYSMGKAGAIVMARSPDEFGRLVEYVNGVPIMVSDYLATENDNTGGKLGSGNLVSVYAIRFGQIEDGGLCLLTGGDTGGVDFFNMVELDNLEDYDASGIRLVAYCALALGSTKAISRLHSIDQTVAVAD